MTKPEIIQDIHQIGPIYRIKGLRYIQFDEKRGCLSSVEISDDFLNINKIITYVSSLYEGCLID